MALIKCPECGKEVSDKAEVCIHCGYPLKPQDAVKEEPKQEGTAAKQEPAREEPSPEGTAAKQEPAKKQSNISSTLLVVIIMLVLCVAGYMMMSRLAYGG